jgi:hypothetical protein
MVVEGLGVTLVLEEALPMLVAVLVVLVVGVESMTVVINMMLEMVVE